MIVDVVLKNRKAYFTGKFPQRKLTEYFRFHPNNYYFMPRYRSGWTDDDGIRHGWDGYISLLKRRRVGTGLFLLQKDKIEQETKIRFRIRDERTRPRFRKVDTDGGRPYQIACFRKMKKRKTGGLILAATRTGKTYIVGLYCKALIGNAVFIVDELTLLDQAQKELARVIGEEVGMIGDQKFLPKRITVATIQTLHLHRKDPKFRPWMKSLDVMFIDELHVQLNDRNFDTVREIKPQVIFGLTATLELKKTKVNYEAHNICGKILYEYPIEKGTSEGYLVPGVVLSITHKQEDWERNEFQTAYKEMIVDSHKRNALITGLVREAHRRGRSIIVIVERVRHVKKLSRYFKDIPHALVFGEKKVEERIIAIKDFDQKKIRLMLTNKVFKKGITIKTVDTILDGAAGQNKNDAVQKFGRGIGLCKGKKGLIYFDISDRSVDGVKRNEKTWNRFSKNTGSRLSAFKQKSIPVHKIKSETVTIRDVLDIGEKLLDKTIAEVKKKKGSAPPERNE